LSKQFEEWNMRGYPTLWVSYKGRGVEWFGGEVSNILDWMRPKRRAFPMRQLGTDGNGDKFGNEFRTQRATDNRFYWLSTNLVEPRCQNAVAGWDWSRPPALLHARIDPTHNGIVIVPFGVRQASVWLGRTSRGESMINFDKPVTITVWKVG